MTQYRFTDKTRRADAHLTRKAQHAYRASVAHTHSVASTRRPGTLATITCTRLDCVERGPRA